MIPFLNLHAKFSWSLNSEDFLIIFTTVIQKYALKYPNICSRSSLNGITLCIHIYIFSIYICKILFQHYLRRYRYKSSVITSSLNFSGIKCLVKVFYWKCCAQIVFTALPIPPAYHLTLLICSSLFSGLPRLAQCYQTEAVVKGFNSLCSHDKAVLLWERR